EEMLAVGDYFEEKIMEHFEELKVVVSKMKDHHAEFVKQMDLDFNAALESARNNQELKELTEKFFNGTNELYAIDISDLEDRFGEKVKSS
ncbi:hypothetical protein JG666_21995, partial [Vibrio cholerae]|nr:hypothetical protein [Vibrio cholerae]